MLANHARRLSLQRIDRRPGLAAEEADPTRSPIIAALRRLGHDVTRDSPARSICRLPEASCWSAYAGRRAQPRRIARRQRRHDGCRPACCWRRCRLPYTGCTGDCAGRHGQQTRRQSSGWCRPVCRLRRGSLPDGIIAACSLPLPPVAPCSFILKSVYEHASFQLNDSAVIESDGVRQVSELVLQREVATNRPFFAEQFIDGREFNLSIWGNESEVLPPAEIDFSAFPVGQTAYCGPRCQVGRFLIRISPHTPPVPIPRSRWAAAAPSLRTDARVCAVVQPARRLCANRFSLRCRLPAMDIWKSIRTPASRRTRASSRRQGRPASNFDEAIRRLLEDALARERRFAQSDVAEPTRPNRNMRRALNRRH